MSQFDVTKSVQNIQAKTFGAPANNGLWTVVCEVTGCNAETSSSKMHGWKTDRWITCPQHVDAK